MKKIFCVTYQYSLVDKTSGNTVPTNMVLMAFSNELDAREYLVQAKKEIEPDHTIEHTNVKLFNKYLTIEEVDLD